MEDRVLGDHLVGELVLDHRVCSALLRPGFRRRGHRGVYSFASGFLRWALGSNSVERTRNVRAVDRGLSCGGWARGATTS